MSLKQIFKLVIGWRLILLAIAIPAIFLITPRTDFPDPPIPPSISRVFGVWSNFDGLHYLNLAEFGYGYQHKTDMDYAFFPLYPLAIRTFNIFGSYLTSGLLLSHIFFILALYFLHKLISIDYKTKTAKSAIRLLLLFPTAFFFGSVYTESLFLLLAVLSFFSARKKNFFLAGVFAALASATRITGVFLWPALIYEYWLIHHKDIKKLFQPKALWLLLPPLGLISFIRFQILQTGNLLSFINIQAEFAGRETDKLILLHQIFYRYVKMVIFVDHTDPLFFTVLLELLSAVLVLVVLAFSLKKIRFSYWIFTLFSFVLSTFAGTFVGMPRFTIVLFPIFIFLAFWLDKQHPYIKIAYYFTSAVFSIIAITLFVSNYFIS